MQKIGSKMQVTSGSRGQHRQWQAFANWKDARWQTSYTWRDSVPCDQTQLWELRDCWCWGDVAGKYFQVYCRTCRGKGWDSSIGIQQNFFSTTCIRMLPAEALESSSWQSTATFKMPRAPVFWKDRNWQLWSFAVHTCVTMWPMQPMDVKMKPMTLMMRRILILHHGSRPLWGSRTSSLFMAVILRSLQPKLWNIWKAWGAWLGKIS